MPDALIHWPTVALAMPQSSGRLQVAVGPVGLLEDGEPYINSILTWVNYNDLTVLPHWKSWLIRGIIPKWPQDSG